jgi:glutathione S-transferase
MDYARKTLLTLCCQEPVGKRYSLHQLKETMMIILYGVGPMFGLPHPSPFVMKAELLLKMSGLAYRNEQANLSKAPKGKIPWIEDDGKLIADSTFIRLYLEEKRGIDFSGGYSDRELAAGWPIEKMLEEHLYWLNVNDRWLIDENFWRGPVHFFDNVPALVRPLIVRMVRRKVRQNNHAQGIGRHSAEERLVLGKKAIDCVSAILGDRKYMLGARICATDATAYGALLSLTCPIFKSEIREYAETKANVMAYLERMTTEFFPGFEREKKAA